MGLNNRDPFAPELDVSPPVASPVVSDMVGRWHGQINELQQEIRDQGDNPCASCWRVTGRVPLTALLHSPETTPEEVDSLGSAHVKALKTAIARRCRQNPEPKDVEWVVTGIGTERSLDVQFSPLKVETPMLRWITIMPFPKNPRCAQDKPDDRQGLIPRQH